MSTATVPLSFLFRYELTCPYVADIPLSGDHVVALPTKARIPFLGGIDNQPERAEFWIGWNESGLGVVVEVIEKTQAIFAEPGRPTSADGLSLWIDTRDTRTIHRASRYCQRFLVAAHDGSPEGNPSVAQHPIKRALDEPPAVEESQIRLARFALDGDGEVRRSGTRAAIKSYRLEAFFPAEVLHGFDPESNRRLGLFYRVRDHEWGDQLLSGVREMPYWEDPSLWATLVLAPPQGSTKPRRTA